MAQRVVWLPLHSRLPAAGQPNTTVPENALGHEIPGARNRFALRGLKVRQMATIGVANQSIPAPYAQKKSGIGAVGLTTSHAYLAEKQYWFNRDQRSAGASASIVQLVAPKLIRQRRCLPVFATVSNRDRPGPPGSRSQPNQSAAPCVGDAPSRLPHAFLVCRLGPATRMDRTIPPCRDCQRAHWLVQSLQKAVGQRGAENRRLSLNFRSGILWGVPAVARNGH